MKNEFIPQYAHTWRLFERLVNEFSVNDWIHAGRKAITPARLSFHILKSVKYYLEDPTNILFASGKSLESDWDKTKKEDLPSQKDVTICITELRGKTEIWLSELDYNSTNTAFDWAGKTKLGVVIFLLKHSIYHLGELSSLLNECKNGEAEDNYVKAL
jgi:hypothetical protein